MPTHTGPHRTLLVLPSSLDGGRWGDWGHIEAEPDNLLLLRLLVDLPTRDRVRRLTIAVSVSHAVKCGNLGIIQRAHASNDFSYELDLARDAAAAYAIEFKR